MNDKQVDSSTAAAAEEWTATRIGDSVVMAHRPSDDEPELTLAARFSPEMPLAKLLGWLAITGTSGELRVCAGQTETTLYIANGTCLSARSNQPEHRIGSVLVRMGLLAPEARDSLIKDEGERFGRAAVRHGLVTADQIHHAIVEQAREIAISALRLESGQCALFTPLELFRVPSLLHLSLAELLDDASQREGDMVSEPEPDLRVHIHPVKEGKSRPSGELRAQSLEALTALTERKRHTGAYDAARLARSLAESDRLRENAAASPPAIGVAEFVEETLTPIPGVDYEAKLRLGLQLAIDFGGRTPRAIGGMVRGFIATRHTSLPSAATSASELAAAVTNVVSADDVPQTIRDLMDFLAFELSHGLNHTDRARLHDYVAEFFDALPVA